MIKRTIFFGKDASHEDAMQAMRWVAETGGSAIFSSEGEALRRLTGKSKGSVGQKYEQCQRRYKQNHNISLGVINQSRYGTFGPRVATISITSSGKNDRLTEIEYDINTHGGVTEFGVYISTFALIEKWAGYYLPNVEGKVPEDWQDFVDEHAYDDEVPTDIMGALAEVARCAADSLDGRFDSDMEDRVKRDIKLNWKHWSILSGKELLAACREAEMTIGDAYRIKGVYDMVAEGHTPRPTDRYVPLFEH